MWSLCDLFHRIPRKERIFTVTAVFLMKSVKYNISQTAAEASANVPLMLKSNKLMKKNIRDESIKYFLNKSINPFSLPQSVVI